jgi:DNA-binding NarL/FixJ family response regulator
MKDVKQQKIKLFVVEDNPSLRQALSIGLEGSGNLEIVGETDRGEDAVARCIEEPPNAVLMDVQLAGAMNGIEAAVAIRREHPRLPVVFYSIQDDDHYYRDFRRSGILSHYAYVRKSNYLLPEMISRLVHDAVDGRSFIDPEIETRVEEVRHLDEHSPLELLEPNEQVVAEMLAEGLTNEQIASRLGFRDKRTVSRINGAIYTAWGLNTTTTDEKVARTRAAIIYLQNKLIIWDDDGLPRVTDRRGDWVPLAEHE